MQEAAKNHRKIASNISELVIGPFGRWCDAHEGRVQNSHDDLQARIRAHDKQAEAVRRLRSAYFNKCRQVEDLEEENKLAFPEPEKQPKKDASPPAAPTPVIRLPEQNEEPEEEENVEIGDEVYPPEQVKKILTDMLSAIPVGEAKVPILGTYTNVSTGADITDYVQRKLGATTVSYAERIGQDLVDRGFLRLVGSVGSSFANSSKMNYQWRPKVFQMTGLPPKQKLQRVGSGTSETGPGVAQDRLRGRRAVVLEPAEQRAPERDAHGEAATRGPRGRRTVQGGRAQARSAAVQPRRGDRRPSEVLGAVRVGPGSRRSRQSCSTSRAPSATSSRACRAPWTT